MIQERRQLGRRQSWPMPPSEEGEETKGLARIFRGWKQRSRERAIAQWVRDVEFKAAYWNDRVARAIMWRPSALSTAAASELKSVASSTRSSTGSVVSYPSSPEAASTPGREHTPHQGPTFLTPPAMPMLELPSSATSTALGQPMRRRLFGPKSPLALVGATSLSLDGTTTWTTSSASPLRAVHERDSRRAEIATERVLCDWSGTLRR